jgi:hypothetical protein
MFQIELEERWAPAGLFLFVDHQRRDLDIRDRAFDCHHLFQYPETCWPAQGREIGDPRQEIAIGPDSIQESPPLGRCHALDGFQGGNSRRLNSEGSRPLRLDDGVCEKTSRIESLGTGYCPGESAAQHEQTD